MVAQNIEVCLPRETVTALRQMAAAQNIGLREFIAARLIRSADVFIELMQEEGGCDEPSE